MATATPEKTTATKTAAPQKATKAKLTFEAAVMEVHTRMIASSKLDPSGLQTLRRKGPAIEPYNLVFRICRRPATGALPVAYCRSLLKTLELALMARDWYVRDAGDKAQIREDLLAQWELVKGWDKEQFDGVRKQVGAAIRAAGLLLKSERFTAGEQPATPPAKSPARKRTVADAIREDVGGDWTFSDDEMNGAMADDEH